MNKWMSRGNNALQNKKEERRNKKVERFFND